MNHINHDIELQICDWASYDYTSYIENEDIFNNDEEENSNKKFKDKNFLINIYGITMKGKSICVHVENFLPYFFVKIPQNWEEIDIKILFTNINKLVKFYNKTSLVKTELVYKKELFGFSNNKEFKFIKLTFKTLSAFYEYREIFQSSINTNNKKIKFKLYETNISPMLRFIHEKNINPASWIKIYKSKYKLNSNKSRCNIEITVNADDIFVLDKTEIAPIIIASFDIECTSKDGSFPIAKRKEDQIIQIGTTVHRYGEKKCFKHHIITLKQPEIITANEIDAQDLEVEYYNTEKEVIIAWSKWIQRLDPDIITGYNIWGFDFKYLYDRAKGGNGGIIFDYSEQFLSNLSRNKEKPATYDIKKLASSALGDNELHLINMEGRVVIDLMKVVQRDHKLESYKLDFVAETFLKSNKIDLPPKKIFENYRIGTPDKIKEIAVYCLKDCVLVNYLINKLEIIANNMGMANVCLVPFSYLFLRGQGIKIFSLVANECRKENILIRLNNQDTDDNSGYEGAIVFSPKPGIYFEPIAVNDFSSLYPSSMIAENISHDSIVWKKNLDNNKNILELYDGSGKLIEKNGQKISLLEYDNLNELFDYNQIEYDNLVIYNDQIHKNYDKKYIVYGSQFNKIKTGSTICCFAIPKDGSKHLLPRILMKLLNARKNTRKKIIYKTIILDDGKIFTGLLNDDKTEIICENEGKVKLLNKNIIKCEDTYNEFMKAVLEGLQLSYKITANSLYGQCGAKTSSISYKELAACTTRIGRGMLTLARDKILEKFDGCKLIYGDTDSCFISFMPYIEKKHGTNLTDYEKLKYTRIYQEESTTYVSSLCKKPHCLEPEKQFYPFIIFSKKRYVGNKYEGPELKKFKQNSMGIVLKRRDNAHIVKTIYGGIIDKILNDKNIESAKQYFKDQVNLLLNGNIDINELIITKSIKSNYVNPTSIAHKVLADNIGERDPGNKPLSNDRIPYCYIDSSNLICKICKINGLNIDNCKCIECMKMFCKNHINNHRDICKPICRFCRINNNITKCNTCSAYYCKDDMEKHFIRTDKFGEIHKDKCKKKLTKKILQGDIIETPLYIKENNIKIDYKYYLDHQIQIPCLQIFSLNMANPYSLIEAVIRKFNNQKNGNQEITKWFSLSQSISTDQNIELPQLNEIFDELVEDTFENEDIIIDFA